MSNRFLYDVLFNGAPLPTPFYWKWGAHIVRILSFDQAFIDFESRSGRQFRRSRFHCGMHFVEIGDRRDDREVDVNF